MEGKGEKEKREEEAVKGRFEKESDRTSPMEEEVPKRKKKKSVICERSPCGHKKRRGKKKKIKQKCLRKGKRNETRSKP